ncbi:MAG TPA: PLP-dependent aminotransferase family protein [Steroidobacteraceae bacterium]|nr:PLP-dependent aminotransferase family protein [Steroidobacteraceae bacterium]
MDQTQCKNGSSSSALAPIPLDLASDIPLYRQIFGWFQGAIAAGTLRPGQRVPSTRELARALNISRIPVLSAYEQLFAEGYLKPLIGVGTCVAKANAGTASRPAEERDLTATALVKATATAKRKISRRAALLRGPAEAWLEESPASRSSTGLPAEFPVGIWSRLVTRHARQVATDATAYGDPMGLDSFRSALAQYLGAFRGVHCEKSRILVTAGSQHALQICALALLDPGDRVWMEEPGFPGAQQAFRSAGGQLVPVPVDSAGLDVECGRHTESRVRAAYVTPSAHFPLGVPMSSARRLALLNWAEHKDAWIIEDDYDSEFSLAENPVASLQDGDSDDRVIHVGTLSAAMFPALRLGYIVVPKDLTRTFAAVRNANDICPPPLHQLAMTDFIQEGHLARHVKRMRALYLVRRSAFVAAILSGLPEVLELIDGAAVTRLTGLLPLGVPDTDIAREVAITGLQVKALSQCYIRPPARGGLILDCANLDPERACDAARALDSVIRRYTSPPSPDRARARSPSSDGLRQPA